MKSSWDLPEGTYIVGYDKGKNGDYGVQVWSKQNKDGSIEIVHIEQQDIKPTESETP